MEQSYESFESYTPILALGFALPDAKRVAKLAHIVIPSEVKPN